MSAIVIDASLALTWCFEDEATAEGDALFDRVRDDGAVVPVLWPLEMCNVLLQAERRDRMTMAAVSSRLELMADLPITTDMEAPGRAWREVVTLARAEGLTTDDAAYLELAIRRGLPLATKDAALARTAKRLGVRTLPF